MIASQLTCFQFVAYSILKNVYEYLLENLGLRCIIYIQSKMFTYCLLFEKIIRKKQLAPKEKCFPHLHEKKEWWWWSCVEILNQSFQISEIKTVCIYGIRWCQINKYWTEIDQHVDTRIYLTVFFLFSCISTNKY